MFFGLDPRDGISVLPDVAGTVWWPDLSLEGPQGFCLLGSTLPSANSETVLGGSLMVQPWSPWLLS